MLYCLSALQVEQIDVGVGEALQVVSGLASVYSVEQLQGRMVLLLVNLKPAKLAGVKSAGMVLAAVTADGSSLDLLEPPQAARVGERVTFPTLTSHSSDGPLLTVRVNEKVQAEVLPALHVDGQGVACFGPQHVPFTTSAGVVTVPHIRDALIK